MDIVKIAVLGIAGVFLAIPLKREKGEYSTFVAMVVGICIFIYLLTKVETVLLFVDSIKSQLPVEWQIHRAGGKDGGNHVCGGICGEPVQGFRLFCDRRTD